MTKSEMVKMFKQQKKVKLTMLLKLVGGFRYTGDATKVTDPKNVTYHQKPAVATKNIFIRGCDIWENPMQTLSDVPIAVIEPGEKFCMCTGKNK